LHDNAIVAVSLEELEKALVEGYLTVDLQGEKKAVPIRDSHVAFALLQAKLQKRL
jgi:hypothetical protein